MSQEKLHFTPPGILITGMGIVSAIADDIETFTQALAEGKSGIKYIAPTSYPEPAVKIGAELSSFSFEQQLNQFSDLSDDIRYCALKLARRAPLTLQTSVISALQAWQQANLNHKPIQPERIGLVIAGHNTSQNYQYDLYPDFIKTPEYLSPRYALQFMDSHHAALLSELLNIQGEGFITGGASASGNVGIIQGSRLIQTGLVDACLVLGVLTELSPMEIQGFHAIGAMGGKQFYDQPEQACRPFDRLHEGFIYGQASACLFLESANSAEHRQVSSQAKVLGGAIKLHASASSEPSLEGEIKTMQTALLQSGLDYNQIDYINTHGSSSPLGDRIEIDAIEQVFGDHFNKIWLNSTKGLTGHCLYSAGVVETIATAIQMQHGFIHGNANIENPIHKDARFSPAMAVQHNIKNAISNSFGFGGFNTSIVLQNDFSPI